MERASQSIRNVDLTFNLRELLRDRSSYFPRFILTLLLQHVTLLVLRP